MPNSISGIRSTRVPAEIARVVVLFIPIVVTRLQTHRPRSNESHKNQISD